MLALFLLLILIAVALGILGAVVKGFFYLLIIGAVILLADLVLVGFRVRSRGRHPAR
jgi:hypothetical protein